MQDYIDFATKNGVTLLDSGTCQFCGAKTKRGIHECLNIFNLGLLDIDFSLMENQIFKFLIVDSHALQHPEIHGRWSNHFHLSRLHLILQYNVKWTYNLSPLLSDYLNKYKAHHPTEYLIPPAVLQRGNITTTDLRDKSCNEATCKEWINKWAQEVYNAWKDHHLTVDIITQKFLDQMHS